MESCFLRGLLHSSINSLEVNGEPLPARTVAFIYHLSIAAQKESVYYSQKERKNLATNLHCMQHDFRRTKRCLLASRNFNLQLIPCQFKPVELHLSISTKIIPHGVCVSMRTSVHSPLLFSANLCGLCHETTRQIIVLSASLTRKVTDLLIVLESFRR